MINLIENKIQDKLYYLLDFQLSDIFEHEKHSNNFSSYYDIFQLYGVNSFPFIEKIIDEEQKDDVEIVTLADFIANRIIKDYSIKIRYSIESYFKNNFHKNKINKYTDLSPINLNNFQIAVITRSLFDNFLLNNEMPPGFKDFSMKYISWADPLLFEEIDKYELYYKDYTFKPIILDEIHENYMMFTTSKFAKYNIKDWFKMFHYNQELFKQPEIDIELPVVKIGTNKPQNLIAYTS